MDAEHRRWPARYCRSVDSLLVLDAVFDEEIQHDLLGTIAIGTISTEYYWLDRWYNVFRFSDADRQVEEASTATSTCRRALMAQRLSYVDLDIDVLVDPDLTYRILDLEDFEDKRATL